MRIQSLTIEDFRGFHRLEMKDLGRINLIVGTNNCGKTTVLEALSILMAHGNPSAVWTVLNRRGEIVWVEPEDSTIGALKFYEVRHLFRGYEIKVGTSFRLAANVQTGAVELVAKIGDEDRLSQSRGSPSVLLTANLPQEFLTTLTLSLTWSNGEAQELEFPISQGGFLSTAAINLVSRVVPRNGSLVQWISSTALTPDDVAALFGDIMLTPDEDMVTEAVKIIEPTIERIGAAASRRTLSGLTLPRPASTFVKLKGVKDRISMRSMGEGVWHLLSLALAVVHSRGGFLLIDDIDTGLHHTVMEDMWKFLDSATRTYHVQVFATTHSRDCYESLATIAQGSASGTSGVTIQRIERDRETTVAYTEGMITAAAKHGYEVTLIMAKSNPNILLVEGDEEKRVIPYLMDHHVVWGDKETEWVAQVQSHGGIDELLEPDNIKGAAMTTGRKAVGIVVDANDHFDSRWAQVRHCCRGIAADFPETLPSEGLIHQNAQGLRIGVWIMPDNQSCGMLETFLSQLIVTADAPLWGHAQESCAKARDHAAPYTDPHRDKANIHTYLAWRDPPGMQLHVSVLARALDARLPLADRFANWFIDLYLLAPR